jgi:hypothetical protein
VDPSIRNRGRLLSLLFIGMYIPSIALLLTASTARNELPTWGGIVDVGLVILIALTGFWIHQLSNARSRADLSHRVAVYLFPAVLVGMWLFRELAKADFNIRLPGLAWRTYFFLSILPHELFFWRPEIT